MSPTLSSSSTIYDHLMINFHQQPKMIMRNNTNLSKKTFDKYSLNSKSDANTITKPQSTSLDEKERSKRRYTITHVTMPEPIVRCSVSNQVYDKTIIRKPVTTFSTWKETNPKSVHSPLSTNIEVKRMDFRPLIINGRRRFNTISSTSPMIIIKKKSPSPLNNPSFEQQKPLVRSIPVNITSNNTALVVSTVIPSSLTCSSSSCFPSTTQTSSPNMGTVFLPIQVTKTQKNNTNTNSTILTTTTINPNRTIESQKGYRYVQKQPQQTKPLTILKAGNKVQTLLVTSDDYDDDPTKMPSSSSADGDGNSQKSTIMTDSNVLRLVRRYDPLGSHITGIRGRRSLETTRGAWHTVAPRSISSVPSNTSSSSYSHLPQQRFHSPHEDNGSVRQSSTPRLQRQRAIYDPEPVSPPSVSNSIRPILKYTSPTSRAQVNVQPKKADSLTIEIEPHVPLPSSPVITNENTLTYQPLITTGAKRVCAAISKSEWDLRLQNDPPSSIMPSPSPTFSVQPPSPRSTINQQQEKESYRPLFGRSKSSIGINNDEQNNVTDDFDENSAPISIGSCVEKLKQLFTAKPSLDSPTNSLINKQIRVDSIESNPNQHSTTNGINTNKTNLVSSSSSLLQKVPNTNSIDLQTRTIPNGNLTKPTTITQTAIPASSPSSLRRPILKSQKTFDSTESLNRSNNSSTMPASELSYDAYRFRRLNDQDQMTTTRLRNVAKVEPYSINTNMVRPLNQLSPSQPTATTTQKARIILNSMGNTPTNSSTSSSAASLGSTIRHPNVRQSDFLTPNPSYSTPPPPPSHTAQPLSNSSSYTTPPSTSVLLSETLSHGSKHRIPNTSNTPLFNGRSTSLASSINHSQPQYRPSIQGDFYANKQTHSPSTYHKTNDTIVNNNNKYEKFDNYTPPNSYHYRPKEFASSTTAINTSLTNNRQPSQAPIRSTFNEQQQQPQQQDERSSGGQQSRRRFQRRKQMKRSKSADLYQESSSMSSKNPNNNLFTSPTNNEPNKNQRQQRSISRDLVGGGGGGGDGHLSSESTSSASTANIERINRAALLRYKSLDSMTFNNRKSTLNGKNTNRKAFSKQITADVDSDDSVCGIPKPRKTTGR